MGDCISPATVQNFANKDTNRIVGKIGEVLALKSPYMDILDGGTLPNVSDFVRSVVQERAVLASSIAAPVFSVDTTLCGTGATSDQVGSTEYTYGLESLRGKGPRVCVKTSRTAFKDSYIRAQQSLEKGILQLTNADIRYSIEQKSGVKFVCRNDLSFYNLLTGDAQAVNTQFAAHVPNAPCTFKTLHRLGTFLREEMLCEPFESDSGVMFKVISGIDQNERFRNELEIKADVRALATGRYTLGEKTIDGYSFEGPYRGFGFGIDQQPLRYNFVDANGQPIFIEPEIGVVTTKGVAARRNPAWITANYEIMFVIAQDSFRRLVPESYVGEGTFKFAPQLAAGELEWTYFRDNDCNVFGDFGQHIYQISRAYQPVRPHAVIPIAFARCSDDLGLTVCASSVNGL